MEGWSASAAAEAMGVSRATVYKWLRCFEARASNAWGYTHSREFRAVLDAIGARHRPIPPYRPQLNGKGERFNRTLLEEWAYVRLYRSNEARLAALSKWLDTYNRRRPHTRAGRPIADQPDIDNVNGNYRYGPVSRS